MWVASVQLLWLRTDCPIALLKAFFLSTKNDQNAWWFGMQKPKHII